MNNLDELKGDQYQAYQAIVEFLNRPVGGMLLLDGYAGTGKSFLTSYIIKWIQDNKRGGIILTAPTHKAVHILKRFNPTVKARTIHSTLGLTLHIDGYGNQTFKPTGNTKHIDGAQYVFVDETSMLPDEIYENLKAYAQQGKKIIFIGDSLQIPPVNKADSIPFNKEYRKQDGIVHVRMNTIIRQALENPIIELSFNIRENIYRPVPIIDRDNKSSHVGSIKFIPHAKQWDYLQENIFPLYKTDQYEIDPDMVKILAWTNRTVQSYNNKIRQYIHGSKHLPKLVVGDKLIADEPLIEDDRVIIPTNSEMTVLGLHDHTDRLDDDMILKYYFTHIRVDFFDGYQDELYVNILHEDSERDFKRLLDMARDAAKSEKQGTFKARQAWVQFFNVKSMYLPVKYNYALTCHKAQGSTYQTAVVLESDIDPNHKTYEKNRILYTACTRPNRDLVVVHY